MHESKHWWRPDVYDAFMSTVGADADGATSGTNDVDACADGGADRIVRGEAA
jgi:hypothetical protein